MSGNFRFRPLRLVPTYQHEGVVRQAEVAVPVAVNS